METINNMAISAAKAVWGESKPSTEEPISGRTGDTSKGEPYDAGNMEPASVNALDADNEPAGGLATTGVTSESAEFPKKTENTGIQTTELGQATGTTSPERKDTSESRDTLESKDTSNFGATAELSKEPGIPIRSKDTFENSDTSESKNISESKDKFESRDTSEDKGTFENKNASDNGAAADFAKRTGTAVESKDTPSNPSTELKAKSGPDDTSKGQDDTRSPEDPKTHPKSAPTDVNDSKNEEGLNEAQQLDGPGPKPLADVAKEHGGDAGNNSTSSVDTTDKEEQEKKSEDDKHESEGTGEKYVQSSGVKADGGDFDATKPGAGREADRLLEQKGLHNPADPSSKGDSTGSPTSEKKSLGQKIKDKLHRH